MFKKNIIHTFYLIFLIVLVSPVLQAQVRIGLWEPSIYFTEKQKMFFLNRAEKENELDDDRNGIADDIFGVAFTDDGKMVGTTKTDTTHDALTHHGWAVFQVLRKSLSNFKIIHAGFTPLTAHLQKTGILDLTIEERKNNLDSEYVYYTQLAQQTVRYFIQQKAQVINMSFGTSASIFADNNTNLGNTIDERKTAARLWMQHFRQAFTDAFKAAPDILFIVAAGNDGEDMDSAYDVPGLIDLPNVICVGALNTQCQPANFTNKGKRIDVYASGENISITRPDGSKEKLSGTSLSVPLITNRIAKIIQRHKNYTASQLKKMIIRQYKKNNRLFCVN